MPNKNPSSKASNKDAVWTGKTGSAFRSAQERDIDIAYTRRMEELDRVRKNGIKLGAKFHGQIIGRGQDKKLEDDYEVVEIDSKKAVAFLKGKKDKKVRRVTFLNKIFGPRKPRGERRNLLKG